MNVKHSVKLSARELMYLRNSSFLPEALAQIVESASASGGKESVLLIDGDVSDEFRETFTERLAAAGFDANYKLTAEGEILEHLIDRFFVP